MRLLFLELQSRYRKSVINSQTIKVCNESETVIVELTPKYLKSVGNHVETNGNLKVALEKNLARLFQCLTVEFEIIT